MRTTERPRHFIFAIGLAVAALTLRWIVHPWLGSLQPFAPGFVAIATSVLFFGWRPAVLTAIVAYVGGTYLFVQQPGTNGFWTGPQDIAAIFTFSLSAGLMIFIGHRARRAERDLAEANEQLRLADRRKDEFLATLSHELRNPVGVITTAVAVLENGPPDPTIRPTLAIIARQVAQMRRLVDDLLDVGRITRGRLAVHPAPADLRNCLSPAVDANRDTLARKRQLLRVHVPDKPVDVHVDHTRIVQVISNLVDNASKYSPEQAEIRVSIIDASDATIEVLDDGPGIDPAVLPHVFDLFEQNSGTSSSEGLGLGLGLCKRIVDMHGGTIDATPNPSGRGTRFVVRLPKPPTARTATEGSGPAHTSGLSQ
jgi:signal transduction histidine kinase